MKFLPGILVGSAMVLFCLVVPLSGIGATFNVTVNNIPTGFSPPTANINVGDKVVWTWPSGSLFHNVTSTDIPQAWPASQTLVGPATFPVTFTKSGNFPYECTVHLFTGSINVASAGVPPGVFITSPTAGAVFSEPANVTIEVTATNSANTVTNVQFLVGQSVLTNETASPFSTVTDGLAAGDYTLSAIASDNMGLTATNSVVISVVTPSPLAIDTPVQLAPTSFQFNYSTDVGLSYIVQMATNLESPNWVAIITNKAASNPVTFVDSNAISNPGFYRVVRLPNP
jgi:plastocyanin